ncbi:DinB family protein [Daejeonella oryzae]|uniref:DinB family protein n=1 Tax=Daejeonella oryzae TaxID=1122943 RepID=UPI00040FDA53|nr:DinB family protein [Daejeonella oryzae]
MLADIIRYTQLADYKVIEVFNQSARSMPQAEKLFSHVLNAQHIWMKRIIAQPEEYGTWQIHERRLFEKIHLKNFILICAVFKEADQQLNIHYTNSKGERFSNRVADIFFHMLNHSTYHRAQISSIFRAEGINPPETDYIMMKREGLI